MTVSYTHLDVYKRQVISLAFSHGEEEESNLTFVGLVAIKDDLRPEAKEGVSLIQNAGIQVVMITGAVSYTHLDVYKRQLQRKP